MWILWANENVKTCIEIYVWKQLTLLNINILSLLIEHFNKLIQKTKNRASTFYAGRNNRTI